MLGQDSLLVLDEAHLSKPFKKLVTSVSRFQNDQGTPMKVICMSATTAEEDSTRFKLEVDDLSDPIIKERFQATKRLTITTLGEKDKLNDKLVDAAIKLVTDDSAVGKRIVVFVRKPDDARTIAASIRNHDSKKSQPGPYADCVEVLTGTMRGLERDELVEKPVFTERWLNGNIDPSDESNKAPAFLVSTSAGEVGFDLNADHLVGDAATLDSWIQRLGRVNRRGKGNATIHLILAKEPAAKSEYDKAYIAASKLLVDGMDVSPNALAEFKSKLSSEQFKAASTPEPTMVELTDILLDAWSMTSITAPMPGRPEVAPWIRGIADELPQTTIAWRVELDLPGFGQLDLEEIEEWFDTHRVLTHEALSVPTSVAAKWFTDRWSNLTEAQQFEVGPRPIVVDRAGLKRITVKELIDQLSRKSGDNTSALRNADLILPASFGGIERREGLLDANAPTAPKDEDKKSFDEQIKARNERRNAPDVADERGRFRQFVTKSEDGDPETRSVGSGSKPAKPTRFVLDLESGDDTRVQLVSYVLKRDKPEWGSKRQTLREHVGLVRKRLDEILGQLALPEPLKRAAQLAADYHDHGKNRERWQRTVSGIATPTGENWSDQTIGKSGGAMKRDARHYRHEFGSLREFIDAHKAATYTDSNGTDITQEVIDLALHLIATHHGRGRPHFPKGGFDPDAESHSPEIRTESIRRFARLQRKYGHWRLAWLENLLRCADALASADQEAEDDVTDESTDSAGGAA